MLNNDLEVTVNKATDAQMRPKPDQHKLGFGQYFTDHMFTMRWNREQGWHDATIQPYANFSLDPAAMVFHYGQAIFEGMKAYRGKDGSLYLFRPMENFKRMNNSAVRLCMPRFPEERMLQILKSLVYLDRDWVPSVPGASLYIRPTMIAVEPGLGMRPAGDYLFFIICSPVGAYYAEGFGPTRIYVEDNYVRSVRGGVGNVKTAGNYAASVKAQEEAHEKGYTQVLWLDAIERRYVEEVGTSNIFFLINDELVTAPLEGSILPGITRNSVIQLAKDWGYTVHERHLSIDEVIAAAKSGALKESFGTGTAAVISPVGELCYKGEPVTVSGGQVGPLSKRLFEELQAVQFGDHQDPHNWRVRVG